jgi:uncharacterized protein YxjI
MLRRQDAGGSGDGGSPNVFQMRQKMFAIGDDFWIEDGAGQRAFKVDGKALRLRKTLIVESPAGDQIYKIEHKLVTIKDTWKIEDDAGTVATVKKALFTPLRERYEVELRSGGSWDIQGNIVDHEYEIRGSGGRIAHVGKQWFRVRDTYGVEVAPGQDATLVLAVAIVVDQVSHPMR